MKIRIFALARDLGLDSKVLIDLCEQAGVKLRNALATITEEERDRVVEYIRKRGTPVSAEAVSEDMGPVREAPPAMGKVRSIRQLTPKSPTDEVEMAEAVADVVEDEVVDAVESELDEAVGVDETAAEPVAEVSGDTEAAEPAAEIAPEVAAVPADAAVSRGEPEDNTASPLRRMQRASDDASRPRVQPIREMKPIASVREPQREQAAPAPPRTAPKPVRAAARPLVAAPPEYTPPTVKKAKPREEKVQKPELSLSDIVDRKSPLADQLRQLKKAREEHETEPEAQTEFKRRGAGVRRGSLLKELKDSREAERQAKKLRRKRRGSPADLKTAAQMTFPITVRNLSEAIGRPARSILAIVFKQGRMITINDELSEDEAIEISMELGVDLEVKRGRDIEVELLASLDHEDPPEQMQVRPPVVTILGHVDHGKTTLVDRIRQSNVAAGEAGGITQHIAAYQVEYHGRKLTFVDTPGHAAFGEMRSRGADVTDIVVLVVAADDGIMAQTVECISHAKNAGVPIVVALNKVDLEGIDEQRILQQLAQYELLPTEWGGECEVVRTSGMTGHGVDNLLETLLLTAELHELKANPDREALGLCLESFRDEGRGALAWFIVQKGTLRVGDVVLCGSTYGRIRAMYDDGDNEIEFAGPSTPVKVAGLSDVPGAGDHFFVMKDIEEARETAGNRLHEGRTESLSRRNKPRTLEDILSTPRGAEGVQELPLILKADSPGSMEALRGEVNKFDHAEVRVSVIHEGIGGVNESDVYLASAAGAIIVAFHVIAEDRAEVLAEREGVEIRRYNIIYEITEHIRLALQGLLRPEKVEVATGRAIVLRTFQISRFGTIAGCRVLKGTIARDNRVHLIRDQKVMNDYRMGSLRREKDDVKEVREGMECGIRLDGFNDVKEGDLLEAFRIDEIKRTLE